MSAIAIDEHSALVLIDPHRGSAALPALLDPAGLQ
jgi:hypothetical protein